jgi:hypothetical protein
MHPGNIAEILGIEHDEFAGAAGQIVQIGHQPALTLSRGNPHIRDIVKDIDILILEYHILGRNHQTITKLLNRHTPLLQLTHEDLKQPPATLFTLVTDTEKENGLGRVLHQELHEGHNDQIIALPGLVPI